ncbi:EF hand domain family, member B (predicted), isoform CRA_b [Rattus norvegicus]|nr:EF-hand domain-containing family member B [Rattus norvegicus]EDL82848.1 EF hand domain family, member B (predicted), isoform CRA_b [Rattus norvegicus]|eukprot:NP_001100349.1 EF-hand domain-containing family member B [Rattus norvegicus]
MCSFVRLGSPKALQTSDSPLEMSSLRRTRAPEISELGLTQEQKDDIRDRVGRESKSPTELGFELRLEQDRRWRERMASSEPKSPPYHALGVGLERQTISATPTEMGNLGLHKGSAFQGSKPLGMLPGRVGSENKGLPPCLRYGGTLHPPLGTVHASPQAAGSTRRPLPCGSAWTDAVVEKQPVGLELRKELEKEPTCVMVKPYPEIPPKEVDIGLPQTQDSDEAKNTEPLIGLVREPYECPIAQQPEEKKEPISTEPGVEPPGNIRPIYSGKFFDRAPSWPTAGKVKPVGYRVANCLTEKLPRLMTPPEAKKYFNFRYPPPGAERIFYGRANDPQIAPYLTHGMRPKGLVTMSSLINPQPITTFQQKVKDKKESIYFSHQRAPLGKSHDQTPGLPKGMDVINTTLGTPTIRELSVRDVVNPSKSFEDVFKEGQEGHDLYTISHNDYFAGEAKNRKYNPASFHRFNLYGVPTPHCNDGRTMAKTLHWLHELQMERGAKIVSKRADDFEEKFQHRLGRVLDPIAETMNVPPGHTFGACLQPEEYGAGDLIHYRGPDEYLRGKDRQRALVAAARHHLKKFNHQHFDTLLMAFRHYDKKGDGVIDRAELHEACVQANLHLDKMLLDHLFDYCDVDQDGLINYLEFANFLTWKDRIPLTEYEKRVVIKGKKTDCENVTETSIVGETDPSLLVNPEDIVPKEPGSSEEIVRTILRPGDKVSDQYKTTSSEINAVVGAVPSICYPIYGVPTIRSDIPAPRIRRVSDMNNYGEEGNAYALLHPSIFSQKGVFERDFFKTRSKEEISDILTNIGVKLTEEEFENVWNLASQKHQQGEVCVETIRNVLDELHADLFKCKTAM